METINNVDLRITTKQTNSGYWIANCPHIMTFGFSKESEVEAIKDCIEAIKTFFEVHIERNTLEKALKYFNEQDR